MVSVTTICGLEPARNTEINKTWWEFINKTNSGSIELNQQFIRIYTIRVQQMWFPFDSQTGRCNHPKIGWFNHQNWRRTKSSKQIPLQPSNISLASDLALKNDGNLLKLDGNSSFPTSTGYKWPWMVGQTPIFTFPSPPKNHRQLEQLQSLLPLSSVDPELAQRTASALAPRLVDATGQMPEATKASFEAVGLAQWLGIFLWFSWDFMMPNGESNPFTLFSIHLMNG